jgi:hypothetical protein
VPGIEIGADREGKLGLARSRLTDMQMGVDIGAKNVGN